MRRVNVFVAMAVVSGMALIASPAGGAPVVENTTPKPPTLKPIKTLEGHGGRTRALAFDRTGRILVSGGSARRLRIWDAKTYEVRATWRAQAQAKYEP